MASNLKASVEQLDSLILAFDDSAKYIVSQEWPEVRAQITIAKFVQERTDSGRIPAELSPKDISRFADNVLSLLRAGNNVRPRELGDLVERALAAVDIEIQATTADKFPRSISLFQLVLAVVVREKIIGDRLNRYWPIVTEELRLLFPAVQRIQYCFRIDE